MIRIAPLVAALALAAPSVAAQEAEAVDALDRLTLDERRALRATPITRVIARYGPAVVAIYGEYDGMRIAPASAPDKETLGTGFLIDAAGFILTNAHVIQADVPRLVVRLHDGSEHRAWLMNLDPDNDVALLKIDAGRDLPTVRMGTSTDLMVGETVIAMGSPLGNDNSVTAGIISSLDRDVRLRTVNAARPYTSPHGDFVQIDAPINPGNSGGPLFNILGEVIGITSAIVADSEGLGFAIPIDRVRGRLSDNLLSPWRRGIDLGFALGYRLSTNEVFVADLDDDCLARRAGLRDGDVILSVAGNVVDWEFDVNRSLLASGPGDVVTFEVKRTETRENGDRVARTLSFDVELAGTNSPNLVVQELMGVRAWDHPRYEGVLVELVDLAGPASVHLELRPGDIVDGVGEVDVASIDELAAELARHPSGTWVEIKGWRRRQAFVGRMRLP